MRYLHSCVRPEMNVLFSAIMILIKMILLVSHHYSVTFFFDVIRHFGYFCDVIWHCRYFCDVMWHCRHSCDVTWSGAEAAAGLSISYYSLFINSIFYKMNKNSTTTNLVTCFDLNELKNVCLVSFEQPSTRRGCVIRNRNFNTLQHTW